MRKTFIPSQNQPNNLRRGGCLPQKSLLIPSAQPGGCGDTHTSYLRQNIYTKLGVVRQSPSLLWGGAGAGSAAQSPLGGHQPCPVAGRRKARRHWHRGVTPAKRADPAAARGLPAQGRQGRAPARDSSQKPPGAERAPRWAPRQRRADLSEEEGRASPTPAPASGSPPASSLAENPNSLWPRGPGLGPGSLWAWENEGTYQSSMAALLATGRGWGPLEAVTSV